MNSKVISASTYIDPQDAIFVIFTAIFTALLSEGSHHLLITSYSN